MPANHLADILAAGGATAIALGVSRGMSDKQLGTMINQRFPGLAAADRQALIQHGQAQAQAALALNSPANAYNHSPASVPVMSELFGDDAGGRRQQSTFVGTDADGNEIIRITMDFPDITDPIQQREAALDRMCLIIGYYPENFPGVDLDECDDLDVSIVATGRRF